MSNHPSPEVYVLPESVLLIHDVARKYKMLSASGGGEHEVLERYYNDLYKFFFNKLSAFDCSPALSGPEKKKLKDLLDELIYVKALLTEESIA